MLTAQQEESEVLADFAIIAHRIVHMSEWRKHGSPSLRAYIKKFTSMTPRRFRQLADAWELCLKLHITRDELVTIHVDRMVRAIPGLKAMLEDGQTQQAEAWAHDLANRTYDEIIARNRVLAPTKREPRAIVPCPHCGEEIEVWSKPSGLSVKKADP